ncbi:acyl-CoA dehydrogenase family protein [Pseudothauera rhizosphaerae]|uniref:Acyl-CoA dehydrogenase n=1 Tax=Pseudothauera rhizosphaerae TaxID=2565932 RepID=A0A4S4AYQ6_9RHOO|nr:acyl-CoA dehydrogenase family protein [Pseudothauera rhizosphaerae]THF65287.1 acyl-CoA dehydrogenase [Pseudothauera rhizosphaerae]
MGAVDTVLLTPAARAAALVETFAGRAAANDRDNRLPLENIADLHAAGLLGLTVPKSEGGLGGGLADALAVITTVSRGDASTALLLSLHYQWHALIAASTRWPAALRARVGRVAVDGGLINALRVEPELGTPVRGGLPATRARRADGGWRLSGRKIYSTGAALLHHAVVWAAADAEDGGEPLLGYFLLPMDAAGIGIVPTWDHLGMRATVSDDVVLDDVRVPADHAVDLRPAAEWAAPDPLIATWNPVLISAAYAGIPEAARDWLVQWLNGRTPTNLGAPLSSLYRFQQVVGEIEALIAVNRRLLQHAAADFDAGRPGDPVRASIEAGFVKQAVTGNAIRAVELAVEAAGNPALMRANPLERLHRDVLCSRIHSPQNDMILIQAGRAALGLL